MTAVFRLESPLGLLVIAGTPASTGTPAGITAVAFEDTPPADLLPADLLPAEVLPLLEACAAELREYFAGTRREFSVPLAPQGTVFQRRVWDQLCRIPFGETRSYLEIAHALGDEKTVRAVGAANGHNPIAVIVPRHRVIGADGSLTGYGGGLWRKEWLLRHEGFAMQPRLFE